MGTAYGLGGIVYNNTTRQVCYTNSTFLNPADLLWENIHNVLEIHQRCIQLREFITGSGRLGFDDRDGFITQVWMIGIWTLMGLESTLEIWDSLANVITDKLPKRKRNDENRESGN
jgi:hypothetical protein